MNLQSSTQAAITRINEHVLGQLYEELTKHRMSILRTRRRSSWSSQSPRIGVSFWGEGEAAESAELTKVIVGSDYQPTAFALLTERRRKS